MDADDEVAGKEDLGIFGTNEVVVGVSSVAEGIERGAELALAASGLRLAWRKPLEELKKPETWNLRLSGRTQLLLREYRNRWFWMGNTKANLRY